MSTAEPSPSTQGPPAALPPSLGPGARPISSQNAPQRLPSGSFKQINDIRSQYSIRVNRESVPPTVTLGYKIRNLSRKYTIPTTSMPLNDATTWLLWAGQGRALVTGTYTIDIIRGAENVAERPLTQSEAEGFALYASRSCLYRFAANWSAVAIGVGMAYYGRKTMKFPFRKPQPLENYESFPSRRLPLAQGALARGMWHFTRTNVYIFLGILLLNPLYRSMSDTSMMVGLARDPRTKDIVMSIRDRDRTKLVDRIGGNLSTQERSGQPQTQQQQGQLEDPDPEGYYTDDQSDVYNDYKGGHSYGSNVEGDGAYMSSTTDTDLLEDSAMQRQEASPQSASGGRNSAWSRRSTPPPPPPSSSSSGDFFDDDASPTAGAEPLTSITANSSPGNSAWDRVRQNTNSSPQTQANPRGIAPPGMRQGPGTSSRELQQREEERRRDARGDSFSFENSEAERQLAKEMAQREFDEMLDRERRGSRDREVGGTGSGFAGQGEDGAGGESAWDRRRRR